MIYTARQLEDLQRASPDGRVVLPYGARLTPLAADWVRSRKVNIGYGDVAAPSVNRAVVPSEARQAEVGDMPLFWWCDGSCGAAKAALAAVANESPLMLKEIAIEARLASDVARLLAREIGKGAQLMGHETGADGHPAATARQALGVLFVQNAAAIMVYANRCRSLRAVLGTSFKAVDLAVTALAANVLVVEYPGQSLVQIRNLLARFVKGPRLLSDEMNRELTELATCE